MSGVAESASDEMVSLSSGPPVLDVEREPPRELHVDDVHVDERPFVREVDRLAHERLASLDVRRVEPLGLDLKVFDDLSQWCESRALLANMKVGDARFTREQAADVRVANELRQLLTRLIEPALVGDRNLARAHHLVDEQHVLANGVHDRRWRDVVPAGPHSGGQALARQRLHPCEQPGNGLHRGVDAQRSDNGGDASAHDFPEKEHRRL